MSDIMGFWHKPAVISPNKFKKKALSSWAYNIAVGCEHACRFCYVPSASVNKMKKPLGDRGVKDTDAQWGQYVFLRPWNLDAFRKSLEKAERTPIHELNFDGNRAVILCSTTDPYQVLGGGLLGRQRSELVRKGLELILEESTLNVRILTRSPLARLDFDLMKRFGNRLLFGMSIPTLDTQLCRVYEPHAPSPGKRLETLQAAKDAGIPVYVACAPVYPDCDIEDMDALVNEVKKLDPVTIFMEPINIRADNVGRIKRHAEELGLIIRTDMFEPDVRNGFMLEQMKRFETTCADHGVLDRLHLWPDYDEFKHHMYNDAFGPWLKSYWERKSEWPS